MNQKGFSQILLILIVLGILGVGGYYFVQPMSAPEGECPLGQPNCNDVIVDNMLPSGGEEATPSPTISTSNWKTYRNEEYGFEVQYPPDWFVEEGYGGVSVINFSSPNRSGYVTIYDKETEKITASSIIDLEKQVRALHHAKISNIAEDKKHSLYQYTSKIRTINGTEFVISEGVPDPLGHDGLLVAWNTLLRSGERVELCCYEISLSSRELLHDSGAIERKIYETFKITSN